MVQEQDVERRESECKGTCLSVDGGGMGHGSNVVDGIVLGRNREIALWLARCQTNGRRGIVV